MPPERLTQLAKAREKGLRVRKERAKPVQQLQASQPIAIPQPKPAKPKVSREQANEAFWTFGPVG